MTEFKDLQAEFDRQKEELEATGNTQKSWAFGLSFIPYVNAIATPILNALGDANRIEAIAKEKESKVREAAALVVAECLIPALSSFADGLGKAAGFFSVMEMELESFEGKAEKGVTSPKKRYYTMMKAQAKEMKSLCQVFYAVLPEVRTDFEAIPCEGTDQNYIDKWLAKKKAELAKKRNISRLLHEIWQKAME